MGFFLLLFLYFLSRIGDIRKIFYAFLSVHLPFLLPQVTMVKLLFGIWSRATYAINSTLLFPLLLWVPQVSLLTVINNSAFCHTRLIHLYESCCVNHCIEVENFGEDSELTHIPSHFPAFGADKTYPFPLHKGEIQPSQYNCG